MSIETETINIDNIPKHSYKKQDVWEMWRKPVMPDRIEQCPASFTTETLGRRRTLHDRINTKSLMIYSIRISKPLLC